MPDATPNSEKPPFVGKDSNGTPTININMDKGGTEAFRKVVAKSMAKKRSVA